MPFTASTLQIGYHSYQHRKLQAAQVTITEPNSAVSAYKEVLNPNFRSFSFELKKIRLLK